MSIIYLFIIVLPIYIEFNSKFCTTGVIRKAALGALSVSGIIALAGKGTDWICISIVVLYLEKLLYLKVQEFNESIHIKKHRKAQ